MKICGIFKFVAKFGNFFKLERKKAEIGKYFIIQKYEMVYLLKQVIEIYFCGKFEVTIRCLQMFLLIERIYHIYHHIFGEVITLQGQDKFHFFIRYLSFM